MAMDERMKACTGVGADIHHYFFLTGCHIELLRNPPYDLRLKNRNAAKDKELLSQAMGAA